MEIEVKLIELQITLTKKGHLKILITMVTH